MNKYRELRDRQQKEFNSLPLGWAFNQQQFDEMMAGWGLDPKKDLDKIVRIPGGGFVQKKDRELLHQTLKKADEEMQAAIAEDKTGEGFIADMFQEELENHEYSYTRDTTDALEALGYTAEEVVADPRLNKGICLAHQRIVGRG